MRLWWVPKNGRGQEGLPGRGGGTGGQRLVGARWANALAFASLFSSHLASLGRCAESGEKDTKRDKGLKCNWLCLKVLSWPLRKRKISNGRAGRLISGRAGLPGGQCLTGSPQSSGCLRPHSHLWVSPPAPSAPAACLFSSLLCRVALVYEWPLPSLSGSELLPAGSICWERRAWFSTSLAISTLPRSGQFLGGVGHHPCLELSKSWVYSTGPLGDGRSRRFCLLLSWFCVVTLPCSQNPWAVFVQDFLMVINWKSPGAGKAERFPGISTWWDGVQLTLGMPGTRNSASQTALVLASLSQEGCLYETHSRSGYSLNLLAFLTRGI